MAVASEMLKTGGQSYFEYSKVHHRRKAFPNNYPPGWRARAKFRMRMYSDGVSGECSADKTAYDAAPIVQIPLTRLWLKAGVKRERFGIVPETTQECSRVTNISADQKLTVENDNNRCRAPSMHTRPAHVRPVTFDDKPTRLNFAFDSPGFVVVDEGLIKTYRGL